MDFKPVQGSEEFAKVGMKIRVVSKKAWNLKINLKKL